MAQPDHIISYIVLHLANKETASSLAQLSKTCPRFYGLCKDIFNGTRLNKYHDPVDIFHLLHCGDGQALVTNGFQEWYQHGALHRDDGPAVIFPDGNQRWYQHGDYHRDNDLPAIIDSNGTQEWYQHGEIHRDDGPAVIHSDGTQEWYQHGELIRMENQ